MKSSLQIGRFGPLTFGLHYTWLFIAVLGLWWLAFVWLPENVPGRANAFYWTVAVVVMLLFVASMVSRERLRAAVGRTSTRAITLYPFGAATPYRIEAISSTRTLFATIASLLFSLALGGGLLFLSGLLHSTEGEGFSLGTAIRAFVEPLGWLNLWVGLINLVPGLPFDGGRLLSVAAYAFTQERDRPLTLARSAGQLAVMAIVFVAVWRGLTTDAWLEALSLVVIAWGAREAEESAKERGMLRSALEEVKARDLMERTRPGDEVRATDTVAGMVRSHLHYAPDKPLPVVDTTSGTVGIIRPSAADTLLQGDWPTTPVLALAETPALAGAVSSDTSLLRLVEIIEDNPVSPAEQPAIPVMDDATLVGSVDPGKLAAFEQIDLELGEEAAAGDIQTASRFGARLKAIVPAIIIVAAMAIVGNIALTTDPSRLRNIRLTPPPSALTFSDFLPAKDSVVEVDNVLISVNLLDAGAVTTASILLDGRSLEVSLLGMSPVTKSASARAEGLTAGAHVVSAIAVSAGGQVARAEWGFWVGSRGTLTPLPGTEALRVLRRIPAPGGKVLANSASTLGLRVAWAQPPQEVEILLDGHRLESAIIPVADLEGLYELSAPAPASLLMEGPHTIRVVVRGGAAGVYVAEWSFSAIVPDGDNIYFKETGYFVSPDFYSFWEERGGLALFGFPISDRMREVDEETGEKYVSQYFERARFELHPTQDGVEGADIMLGRIGAEVRQPDPPTTLKRGAQFFPETGHNLSGPFLNFWNDHGGIEIFGYPVSEELREVNPLDGKEYAVQYFERSRFELLPEVGDTPAEVHLGLLGAVVLGDKSNEVPSGNGNATAAPSTP